MSGTWSQRESPHSSSHLGLASVSRLPLLMAAAISSCVSLSCPAPSPSPSPVIFFVNSSFVRRMSGLGSWTSASFFSDALSGVNHRTRSTPLSTAKRRRAWSSRVTPFSPVVPLLRVLRGGGCGKGCVSVLSPRGALLVHQLSHLRSLSVLLLPASSLL